MRRQVCLHSRPITSLALTADGKHFFTASSDGAVFMCKIQVNEKKEKRAEEGGGIPEPHVSSDGRKGGMGVYSVSCMTVVV